MHGRTIRVLPRHTFDFSYLAASTSETRVLLGRIDASQFTQAELVLRLHNKDLPSGAKVSVEIFRDGSTDEDPQNPFVNQPSIVALDVTSSVPVGTLLSSPVTTNLGSMLGVRVVGSQASQLGDVVADISADLVLKNA